MEYGKYETLARLVIQEQTAHRVTGRRQQR